ncbi:hypothetical protein ACJMK2_043780 [Sinanodonta woodiana]|uniref:Uncharacterized protein n=1 Tax=Sinanodonta woodiana TaxID=1069815 RepID=A0ABD3VZ96_SINWO
MGKTEETNAVQEETQKTTQTQTEKKNKDDIIQERKKGYKIADNISNKQWLNKTTTNKKTHTKTTTETTEETTDEHKKAIKILINGQTTTITTANGFQRTPTTASNIKNAARSITRKINRKNRNRIIPHDKY